MDREDKQGVLVQKAQKGKNKQEQQKRNSKYMSEIITFKITVENKSKKFQLYEPHTWS